MLFHKCQITAAATFCTDDPLQRAAPEHRAPGDWVSTFNELVMSEPSLNPSLLPRARQNRLKSNFLLQISCSWERSTLLSKHKSWLHTTAPPLNSGICHHVPSQARGGSTHLCFPVAPFHLCSFQTHHTLLQPPFLLQMRYDAVSTPHPVSISCLSCALPQPGMC